MKKSLFLMAIAAGSLALATSCSSDEPQPNVNEGGVTFTVKLPSDLQARTFGDGLSASQLNYVVYETGQKDALNVAKDAEGNYTTIGEASFNGTLETTVSLDLPRGKHYDIIFFAKNPNAPYTLDAANQKFTINYDDVNECSENYDAFVRTLHDFSITGPTSTEVVLYRPFAQINVGTTDLAVAKAAKMDVSEVTFTVTNTYTEFNFMGGQNGMGDVIESSLNEEPIAFTAPIPENEIFPCAEAPANTDLMSMYYVLVPTEKELANVTFRVTEPTYQTLRIDNVFVQRNHRTNIWGTLLTSPADFHVIINPIFDVPAYNVEVWTGAITKPADPVNDETGKPVYTINTPGELAYLATIPSKDRPKGIIANINSDMDMSSADWKTLDFRANGDTGGTVTLDFQGHTVTGLNAPLIGSGELSMSCCSVRNVTFKDCNITSAQHNNYGVLADNNQGDYENITIKNCTITVSEVKPADKYKDVIVSIGGINGQFGGRNATNCKVDGLKIVINAGDAETYIGGLFGTADDNDSGSTATKFYFNGCSINNVTVESTGTDVTIGSIFGRVGFFQCYINTPFVSGFVPADVNYVGATYKGGTFYLDDVLQEDIPVKD